ncbi:hypothetical protein JXO52_08645 [bacterium]|nr:hypothetical protein [bacterium]
MKRPLRTCLLAYPDNPVGHHFIQAFIESGTACSGIVLETGAGGGVIQRLRKKIAVDGPARALFRILQVYWMRVTRRNIAALARRNDIPVYRVDRFNSGDCRDLLASLDLDLLVIASAPILKPYVFEQAGIGCLNAHPGWLPVYRGLGANANALLQGADAGVTVHMIDAGIDTGKIIMRETVPLRKGDTVARINDRAVARGAEMIVEVIGMIQRGGLSYPVIDEPVGDHYRSMPYREVKRLNRRLRRQLRKGDR